MEIILAPPSIVSPTLPRIIPVNGNGNYSEPSSAYSLLPEEDIINGETYEEAKARLMVKYEAMSRLGHQAIQSLIPSLIVSGPPGVSKTYTMEAGIKASGRKRHDGITPVELLNGGYKEGDEPEADYEGNPDASGWYDHISGGCRAPGLYHSLWNMRNGGLILIDDCDGVFEDTESLNLIKIATDSTKERILCWRKRAAWLDQYEIARTFEFKGTMIFLTNIDFERIMNRDSSASDHFKALVDRARYLCLTIRTKRDFMIVLRWLSEGEDGMLKRIYGMDAAQATALFDYVEENADRFYNLSLRLIGQIAHQITTEAATWQKDIEATKMKTQ